LVGVEDIIFGLFAQQTLHVLLFAGFFSVQHSHNQSPFEISDCFLGVTIFILNPIGVGFVSVVVVDLVKLENGNGIEVLIDFGNVNPVGVVFIESEALNSEVSVSVVDEEKLGTTKPANIGLDLATDLVSIVFDSVAFVSLGGNKLKVGLESGKLDSGSDIDVPLEVTTGLLDSDFVSVDDASNLDDEVMSKLEIRVFVSVFVSLLVIVIVVEVLAKGVDIGKGRRGRVDTNAFDSLSKVALKPKLGFGIVSALAGGIDLLKLNRELAGGVAIAGELRKEKPGNVLVVELLKAFDLE